MKIVSSFIAKTTNKILITAVALFIGVLAPVAAVVTPHKVAALSPTTYYNVPFGLYTDTGSVVTGSDGNLWFAENVYKYTNYFPTQAIVRMTTTGTFTKYTLPLGWDFSSYGVSMAGMTNGPDGAIWFTDSNTNQIVRLTTAGQFTNHYFATSQYAYGDIGSVATGADGNLWFTMPRTNKIVRMTTAGVMTQFPLAANTGPLGITSGVDGNVWFIESQVNKIAKISPTGIITEYPVPNSEHAWGVIAGPDGNMWFAEINASKIAKITPAGVITEYPTPPSSALWNLTVGSDGALWFLSPSYENGLYGLNLARMTTSGATSTYSIFGAPKASIFTISGLNSGAGGALWAANSDSNQIVRIDPVALLTPAAPTNLTAASPTKVPALSWDAVSGATSYKVYRDGAAIATVTTTSYTDSAAAEGTHSYYVTAANDSFVSSASNTINVSVDKTRPTMSFVEPTSFADPFTVGPTVTVSASDASGLSVMAIHVYTSANQLLTTCGSASAAELAAGTMSCSLASLPDGVYYIKAGTFDNAGNNKTILSGNFTIQHS